MADKHPYTSGTAGVTKAVAHLRKSFPPVVTADTFKKLGIAPNNETYLINILRFLDIIDAEGKKNPNAGAVLVQHDEAEFQKGFAQIVETAYSALFELHGPNAWTLTTDQLISFFRNSDHTSDIVGRRQAGTFQVLAVLSGKLDGATQKTTTSKVKKAESGISKKDTKKSTTAKISGSSPQQQHPAVGGTGKGGAAGSGEMALTVRIEINLPPGGDKETYDNIFKSIRENLLNGKPA